MKIDISTISQFNKGDRIYYLHKDKDTNKYRAEVSFVKKIIIEPFGKKDECTGFNMYYLTSNGKLVYHVDAFATELKLWERYKDSPDVQRNI